MLFEKKYIVFFYTQNIFKIKAINFYKIIILIILNTYLLLYKSQMKFNYNIPTETDKKYQD